MRLRWVQRVDADAQALWKACATAEGLSRWQADEATGVFRPGGSVQLQWPSLGVGADLDVERVQAPNLLVMRNGDARVEYEIVDGAVTLTHSGLSDDDDLDGFASSWRCALAVLAHSVEKQPGRDRRVHWETATVHTTAGVAHAMFTDGAALAAWLGKSEGIGRVGSSFAVDTPEARLSGRVLCHVPGRDVALSYDRDGAVVVLRTLPSPIDPEERTIAIQRSRWSGDPSRDPSWGGALGRLAAVLRQGGAS